MPVDKKFKKKCGQRKTQVAFVISSERDGKTLRLFSTVNKSYICRVYLKGNKLTIVGRIKIFHIIK